MINQVQNELSHYGVLGMHWGQHKKGSEARQLLKQFDEQKITPSVIKLYAQKNKRLSHVKTSPNTEGRLWVKSGKPLAMVNVETKTTGEKWVQGLEVFDQLKGKGISYELLDIATKDLKATHLSVNKKNSVAISLYDKYGFKTYESTDNMLFMKIEKKIDIEEKSYRQKLATADKKGNFDLMDKHIVDHIDFQKKMSKDYPDHNINFQKASKGKPYSTKLEIQDNKTKGKSLVEKMLGVSSGVAYHTYINRKPK